MKQKELRTSMFAFGVVLALLLLFGFQNCSPMLPLDGVVDSSSVATRSTAAPGSGVGLPVDTGGTASGPSPYDGSCSTDSVAQPMAVNGAGDAPGSPIVAFSNPDGRAAFWNISKGAIARGTVCWMSSNIWTIAAVGDFNGDSNPDIIWRDNTGKVVVWLMRGSTRISSALVGNGTSGWQIEGSADFNGDGKADLLWRKPDGTYTVWFMNGLLAATPAPGGWMSPNSHIVTTTDFNGDRRAEVLWNTNGSYSVTSYDAANGFSTSELDPKIFAGYSSVIGFGNYRTPTFTDFFGVKSADGYLYLHYTDGTATGSDSPSAVAKNIDPSWTYLFSRDLDGDGYADWVWTIPGANGPLLSYTHVALTPGSTNSFQNPIQSGFSAFVYPHF